jgi:hypothetical protein
MLLWQTLELYGVEQAAVFVPPGEEVEETRYVAIGASLLNGSTVPDELRRRDDAHEEERVNYFDEFRRREPEKNLRRLDISLQDEREMISSKFQVASSKLEDNVPSTLNLQLGTLNSSFITPHSSFRHEP